MALSGSFYTGWSPYVGGAAARFLFSWSGTQSIENNTTTISWNLTANLDPSGYHRGVRKIYINIGGVNIYTQVYGYNSMLQAYNNNVVASGTYTVTHNESGDKTVVFNVYVNVGMSDENAYNANATNQSYTLDSIPRGSTIACTSPVTMGTTQTVTVTQKAAGFSHILLYKKSTDSSYTEIGRNTATHSYSWSVPDNTANIINADFDTYTLLCRTYTNASYEGSPIETILNIVANIPASAVPTIVISSISELNTAVPSNFPYLIGVSKIQVRTRFTGYQGSTCISRTVQVNSEKITSTSSSEYVDCDFGTPLSSNANSIVASCKDSRGRTGSASQVLIAYPYSSPNVQVDATRVDSNGDVDPVGEYLKVRAKYTVQSVKPSSTELNSGTLKVYLNDTLKHTETITMPLTTGDNYVNIVTISGVSISYQYTLRIEIEDAVSTTILEQTVPKATIPFSTFDDGEHIGVSHGRIATEEGEHHYMEQHFHSGVPIKYHHGSTVYSKNNLLDLIYPVGSIYMNVTNVNPSTFLGGTWVQIEDVFLLGAGSIYSNGATGGKATMTWDDIAIRNTQPEASGQGTTSSNTFTNRVMVRYPSNGTPATGNNLPPYLVVYIWKRTA